MRIVLDTNVLLDGVQDDFSAQAKLITTVIAGNLTALASAATRREYQRLIRRLIRDETYQRKLTEFLGKLEEVEPQRTDVTIDDEEDRKFIAAALGGKADLIVTQDRHLLDIGEVATVRIVTPQEAWLKWQDETNANGEWQGWMRDLGIAP